MTMNPIDLLSAVQARWRTAALLGGALFLIIAILAFIQPRQYAATSSLLLDLSQTDPTDANNQPGARVEVDSILGTQTDVIRSAKVINAVAKEAGFVDALPKDIPLDALRSPDNKAQVPPLHGALLKNEQDVHLFERLIAMARSNR